MKLVADAVVAVPSKMAATCHGRYGRVSPSTMAQFGVVTKSKFVNELCRSVCAELRPVPPELEACPEVSMSQ